MGRGSCLPGIRDCNLRHRSVLPRTAPRSMRLWNKSAFMLQCRSPVPAFNASEGMSAITESLGG
jgi:hypothetical protein